MFTNFTLGLLLFSAGLPLYHFIIYPLFYNHIPSMLRRTGAGFFLVLLSYLFSACALGGLCHHEPYLCNTSVLHTVSSSVHYWLILSSITYNIGFVIALVSLIEFSSAQTPHSVAGMMTAFIILCIFCTGAIGWCIFNIMSNFLPDHFLGLPHLFYKDLLYGCLSLIFFILYIWRARRYKFRERSDIVPIHLLAENYFEKEYVREKAYLQRLHHDQITLT